MVWFILLLQVYGFYLVIPERIWSFGSGFAAVSFCVLSQDIKTRDFRNDFVEVSVQPPSFAVTDCAEALRHVKMKIESIV